MLDLPHLEKKLLRFWQKEKIFEKSIEARPRTRQFVFYEGPPTANARPGIHHVLARIFKDVICRYKTMKGFKVVRRAGWDTHGLPVELEIEKKLGIKNKSDIEKYGVAKFNQKCRESVWQYKKDWEEMTRRIGFWLDLNHPYITYENEYIKKVWQILEKIYKKGLLYQDYKVVHYCPRCGTALSSHEVAQGYKKIKEKSIYVRFKLKAQSSKFKTTTQNSKVKKPYLLVWTTTPWTLPANVALAVHPQGKYKDFIGLEYEPLYPNEGPHKVVGADFVSGEEGTGIVHIAPAYGEEDLALAQKENLPVVHTVDEEGKYKGKFVKEVNEDIIKDLRKRGLLEKVEWIEHEYPFCWRCDTPLLYYAKKSWFVKMTKVKDELIKNAQKINWLPEYIKKGRFGEWLKQVKDWAISRERYWGTPLPIWQCEKCNKQEIKTHIKLKDLHRPYIDKITFKCQCSGKMKRVPEVIDAWFDAGAMPFASEEYETGRFPADFISEAIDQTRGWFYTLLAISTLLDRGPSYLNVICLGHVVDEKGQKMSKSRGNIIEPEDVLDKYGADACRWYLYTINQSGQTKRFDLKGVEDCLNKTILTLWNSWQFFTTYKEIKSRQRKTKNLLDQWIISKLNLLIKEATKWLDQFKPHQAAWLIEDFIDDFSNWYIRRSRKGFHKETLKQVLNRLCQVVAPFMPFVSEYIFRDLTNKQSVHLTDWPRPTKVDQKLLKEMALVREIVALGLAQRAKTKIKVRQPLASLELKTQNSKLKTNQELINLIQEEVNVKEVKFIKGKELKVELDTKITPELKQEGFERELVRQIQQMRKKAGLKVNDKIILYYQGPKISDYVKKEVLAEKIIKAKKGKEIRIDNKKIWLHLRPRE